MRFRHCIPLVLLAALLGACSALLPPTVTPTPTPSFGIEKLRNVFQNLPEGYVEVDPQSRELGSANFNDAFDLQLAFRDNSEYGNSGFSISMGILSPSDQAAFDYALEKEWGTADTEAIRTRNIDRAVGLFWLDIGDIALGGRHLDLPVRGEGQLRESLHFRRGEVAVVVKFAQQAQRGFNPFGFGASEEDLDLYWRLNYCGTAYICLDQDPRFITAPQAARMVDEAIVRFYGGIPASGDG